MNALSSFDPDSEEPRKAPAIDLKGLSHCPTCKQALAKKIKRDEIWKVIRVFKMVSWPDVEDKGWDKMYVRRYSRPAKELIEFMGDWKLAADAVQDICQKMIELGRDYTFETIAKHSATWKKELLELEASPKRINQERLQKDKGLEVL
jgi:hypothetical protein